MGCLYADVFNLNILSSAGLFLFLLCIGDWGIRYHKQLYGFLMAKSANINDQKYCEQRINESVNRVNHSTSRRFSHKNLINNIVK